MPMFAHFFNNAFGVIMIYLYRQEITDLNVEDNTAAPLQYVVLNACLNSGATVLYMEVLSTNFRDKLLIHHINFLLITCTYIFCEITNLKI